jgi:alkylated DNA repair protein alkB homolog 1
MCAYTVHRAALRLIPAASSLLPHPCCLIPVAFPAGDTLCGHVDDAETDVTAPIVSISMGAAAVFLVGGHTRDTPPTPLLLRSGDIVVLSGEARTCYHGVPRVLPEPELPLPSGLTDAAKDVAGEMMSAVLQHARRCRINVSVRAR